VTSNEFKDGESMPKQSLCSRYGGIDRSPSLTWVSVPNAKSYALLSYDPDLPDRSVWIHWILKYIPATRNSLPILKPIENKYVILSNGDRLIQGFNSWDKFGWGGPCPGRNLPRVPHRYYFVIFALDTIIDDKGNFMEQLAQHTINRGEIYGTFLKP